MRRFVLFVMSAIASFAAHGYDSVQLTYRGHLKYNDFSAPRPDAVAMTFRLYAGKSDQIASWSNTVSSVELDVDGFFQVALSGNGLADVIKAGKAEYIGVTVGAGKEQYPRQQLLSSPSAVKSALAGALSPSPAIGTAKVRNAEFKSVTVASVDASGNVDLPVSDQILTIDVVHRKKDFTLKTKGEVTFFRRGAPVDIGTATTSGGGVSFKVAECNCAAFFTTVGSTAMPGLVRLVKKGETIAVPKQFALPDGLTVRCLVYPIGAE